MQAAFLACDAYQCGYCTSGQIMSAVALLKEPCGPDDAAVKELMSGNICRCGAYANIISRDPTSSETRLTRAERFSMHIFEFIRPADQAAAIGTAAQSKTAQQGADVRFLGGGTTLIDLMKLDVETPARVLDINRLAARQDRRHARRRPEDRRDGPQFRSGESTQECSATTPSSRKRFFPARRHRSATWPQPPGTCCRERGASISATRRCPAINANREPAAPPLPAAIARWQSWEPAIIASPPTRRTCAWRWQRWRRSSTCKDLRGHAAFPFGDFHLLPGDTPHRETVLEPGDLITHVTLPPPIAGSKQFYLKLRDRASYEFALASAAVVLTIAGGNITCARIALGGVGTKPWRSPEAEAALVGKPANDTNFPQRGRSGAAQMRSPRAKTNSRSNWPSAALRMLCEPRRQLIPRGELMATRSTTDASPIGRDTPRVDGPQKVTGVAQYTSDFHFPGMLYAVPVGATIANGQDYKARYRRG